MKIDQTIEKLIDRHMYVDELSEEDINTLKAIGWQFALMWRHTADKSSKEANDLGAILMQIKTLVKSK
ncbi:MAG: hypothetical protein DRG24_05100 [Epsilonproteobacteria bacterium]|nr:MAG: hypothetical protein DRG24_05100 [Campylobacterota bacterium]